MPTAQWPTAGSHETVAIIELLVRQAELADGPKKLQPTHHRTCNVQACCRASSH